MLTERVSKTWASCVEQVAMRRRPQLRDGERYEGVARRRCHESIGHIAPTRATGAIIVAQLVAEDGHAWHGNVEGKRSLWKMRLNT